MKTSIDTINGRLCTVVRWPFSEREQWVRQQLAMGMPVVVECDDGSREVMINNNVREMWDGTTLLRQVLYSNLGVTHVITALPAFRKPAGEESIEIFRQYTAQGLFPVLVSHKCGKEEIHFSEADIISCLKDKTDWIDTFYYALDIHGNRHEIAIED